MQPKDLEASEISVRLGATWIPAEYVQQFLEELLDAPYPLMRKLSEKGMIRDVGSARVGKVYARQFLPAISRPEYMALRIMETLPEAELPQFLSYFSY